MRIIAFIFFILFSEILFLGCSGKDKSIDVYSYTIHDKGERLTLLKQYIGNRSGLLDAEYHLWYKDNSQGLVAGPSDYQFVLALKIVPDSIPLWIKDLRPCHNPVSLERWSKLKLNQNDWNLSALNCFYSDVDQHVKLVSEKGGIILTIYQSERPMQ